MIKKLLRNILVNLFISKNHKAEVYEIKKYVKVDGVLFKYDGSEFKPVSSAKRDTLRKL
jgi:hypothetical protein